MARGFVAWVVAAFGAAMFVAGWYRALPALGFIVIIVIVGLLAGICGLIDGELTGE